VHAGLKCAVAQGKQRGRRRIDPALEKRIQALLDERPLSTSWSREAAGTQMEQKRAKHITRRRCSISSAPVLFLLMVASHFKANVVQSISEARDMRV
jgi:hypothetical protein